MKGMKVSVLTLLPLGSLAPSLLPWAMVCFPFLR
jgi:hypothetical protein